MENEPFNQSIQPNPVLPEPQGKSYTMIKKIVPVVLGIIVLGALGTYAYFASHKSNNDVAQESPSPTIAETTPTESYSPLPTPVESVEYNGLVAVKWDANLKQLDNLSCGSGGGCMEQTTFIAGSVTSAPYQGSVLYLEEYQGLGASFQHYVIQGTKRINLKQVKGIHDAPEFINFPLKAGYRLKRSFGAAMLFKDLKDLKKIFTDPVVGDVYLDEKSDCLFVKLPDQTALAYDVDISFANRENGALQATFGGAQSSESYEYTVIRGCGALCIPFGFVDEAVLKPSQRLEIVGKTATGEDLFGIRNSQDPVLEDLYNDRGTVAYYSDQGFESLPKSKYTYEQFIAYRPLLYWKDPLGRWVEFKNKRFVTAAEMCKPVIYLYPETTTDLTVKVHPNGGFTYTNPQYDNGWQVRAFPDGKLTDLRTGKQHDYLFWEGIGLNYPVDDKGWVVKREDIAGFIDEKLSLLGLRGRELSDFKEYWTHRLSERPYYKLSFLSEQQFNEIAPLEVSQSPATAIRILMTAEGLDTYRSIKPQELTDAPIRSGFTLIEWGGVVLK